MELKVNYQIDWLEDGVVIDCTGVIAVNELDDVSALLYQDPRFEACRYQLFDLSDAELSQVSLANMRNTAELDQAASLKFPFLRLAIVSQKASSEALLFHYKLAAEVLGIKWEIKSFARKDQALEWAQSS